MQFLESGFSGKAIRKFPTGYRQKPSQSSQQRPFLPNRQGQQDTSVYFGDVPQHRGVKLACCNRTAAQDRTGSITRAEFEAALRSGAMSPPATQRTREGSSKEHPDSPRSQATPGSADAGRAWKSRFFLDGVAEDFERESEHRLCKLATATGQRQHPD